MRAQLTKDAWGYQVWMPDIDLIYQIPDMLHTRKNPTVSGHKVPVWMPKRWQPFKKKIIFDSKFLNRYFTLPTLENGQRIDVDIQIQ